MGKAWDCVATRSELCRQEHQYTRIQVCFRTHHVYIAFPLPLLRRCNNVLYLRGAPEEMETS